MTSHLEVHVERTDGLPRHRLRRSLLTGALVLSLGLVVATTVLVSWRRVQANRRARTEAVLQHLAHDLGEVHHVLQYHCRTYEDPEDDLLARLDLVGPAPGARGPNAFRDACDLAESYRKDPSRRQDAWGHWIRCRCPGPVHKHGWDLYSVGPNDVDELGEGDDILVGADVVEVTSAR